MKANKVLPILFVLFSLAGFVDATFLTVKHYLNVTPPCFITSGCETVLTSSWSSILGIPVSLLGAMFYLCILLLTIAYLNTTKKVLLKCVSFITTVGFLFTLFLVVLQIFVIREICFYCMVSATTATLLFITGIIWFAKNRKNQLIESPIDSSVQGR